MTAQPDRPHPDTAPLTSDAPDRLGLRGLVARRWPTLLALALVAPGLADRPTPETVEALASAMLLLPLWYLVITATGRRSWTWPVLVVGIAAFVLLRLQDRVEPAVVLLAVALVAVLWGSVRTSLTPAQTPECRGRARSGAAWSMSWSVSNSPSCRWCSDPEKSGPERRTGPATATGER